jgi:hypothetical protein
VRNPTFSRQSGPDSEDERPTLASGVTTPTPADRVRDDRPRDDRDAANRDANVAPPPRRIEPTPIGGDRRFEDGRLDDRRLDDRTAENPKVEDVPLRDDKKPRASVLATLGLVLSVVAAMLVLSGPLLGYGLGMAVLALILSLSGLSATGKRHVAGKTDALLGMVLSLAAVVVGVLALTGSLSWLGTDTQPVNSLREWLDTRFANRF